MKSILYAFPVLLLGFAPAVAQHHGHGAHGTHAGRSPDGRGASKARRSARLAGKTVQTPATREYQAAHHEMMRAMDQPYTGNPDADFRIQMIPHHQGAIDMARVALRRAADPWTRQLAEAIIVEQEREIYDMRNWLARHGYRAPEGGRPRHVIRWNSYRNQPASPGTLEETQGTSWTPGSGVPRQR